MENNNRGRRRTVVGEVVKNKMEKTITVQVFRMEKHEKYGKYVKKVSLFKAHDEKKEAALGDTVEICETRPLSKTKRWKLTRVVSKA